MSVVRNGSWTHQDEKTFLQKWYRHFGIALSDAGSVATPFDSKPTTNVKSVELQSPPAKTDETLNQEKSKNEIDKASQVEVSTKLEKIMLKDDHKGFYFKMLMLKNLDLTSTMTPTIEAHFDVLRLAHEKQKAVKEKQAVSFI